jgi:site-specific recombinase
MTRSGFGSNLSVVQAFDEPHRDDPDVHRLATLWQACACASTLPERLDALVAFRKWIRVSDARMPLPAGGDPGNKHDIPPMFRRQHAVLCLQERSPELDGQLRSLVSAILRDTSSLALFAETGLPCDRGLVIEFLDRFWRRVLPAPREDTDLSKLLIRLFTHNEAERFALMPADIFGRVVKAYSDRGDSLWRPMVESLWEAFRLLAVRIQALGVSEKLRVRSSPVALLESPFFRLARASETLERSCRAGEDITRPLKEWRRALKSVRHETQTVEQRLAETGVNLDVVFSLYVIGLSLERLEAIAAVLTTPPGAAGDDAIRRLLRRVTHDRLNDRSLLQLMRVNLRLMATRIVDHASRTGEHYIAGSRDEYRHMWRAAAGGGLVTAGTAAIKFVVAHTGLPLFVEGFLASVNYAVSFILIQSCHFVLATKQPSMTAATFASIIRNTRGESRMEELSNYVAQIFRSQIAAAFGNILAAAAAAAVFEAIWRFASGRPYLSVEESEYLVHSISPWASGTMFYAALTGVLLWLSSVAGGWIDNWTVYRKVPQSLADHPIGDWIGHGRLRRIADALPHNVAGWGGSIALGFMLGMTPVVGMFFGLPLDVRHVTLTTGSVAFAAASLGRDYFYQGWFIESLAGVGVIFVLNLTTSFAIALLLAMRAYDISARDHFHLLWVCIRRLWTSPREFFLPPRPAAYDRPVHPAG